jgi:hypothetical protein
VIGRIGGVAASLVLASLLGTGAAGAPDRPVFPPARDVAVTYRTDASQPGASPAGLPQQMLVRYSVQADRLRVEAGLPSYLLIDRKSQQATVVIERLGIMADLPRQAGLEQAFMLDSGKRFTRRGTETVAGLRCTVWDVVAAGTGAGTACVTADGVLLRASGHDRHGRDASLEAIRVEYAPQADALFFPPANLRHVDLPASALAAAAGVGGTGVGGAGVGMTGAGALLDRLRGRP